MRKEKTENYRAMQSMVQSVITLFFMCLIFFACAVMLVQSFNGDFEFFAVSGTSMQPYLNPDVTEASKGYQDAVLVKLTQNVDRGDVVIVNSPESSDETWIKRVIATAGDKITIKYNTTETCTHVDSEGNEVTYQNGCGRYHVYIIYAGESEPTLLDENDYLSDEAYDAWTKSVYHGTTVTQGGIYYESTFYNTYFSDLNDTHVSLVSGTYYYEIDEDYFVFMGDNRYISKDARKVGQQPVSSIIGRVVWVSRNGSVGSTEGDLTISFWSKLESLLGYYWEETVRYFAWA